MVRNRNDHLRTLTDEFDKLHIKQVEISQRQKEIIDKIKLHSSVSLNARSNAHLNANRTKKKELSGIRVGDLVTILNPKNGEHNCGTVIGLGMKFATIQTLKGPIIRRAPKNLVVKDSESNPIKKLIY